MAGRQAYDFSVATVWFLLGVMGLVRFCRHESCRGVLRRACGRCRRLVRRLAALLGCSAATAPPQKLARDPWAGHIKAHIEKRRQEHAARFARLGSFFMSSVAALAAIIPAYRTLRNDGDRLASEFQDVLFVIMVITANLLDKFPALQRGRWVIFCHFALMAETLLFIWPLNMKGLMLWQTWKVPFVVLRMFFSLVPLRLKASVISNTVFSITMMVCIEKADHVTRTEARVNEVMVLVSIITFLALIEGQIVDSASKDVKELFANGQHSASESLLNMVCDALVELDAECRISGGCPFLSSVLLHGSGSNLEGELLESYVHPEDVALFQRSMHVPDSAEGLQPKMFHVRFRDACGTPVTMELFHVPFSSVGGELRHMVGLKEHVDFVNLHKAPPPPEAEVRANSWQCDLEVGGGEGPEDISVLDSETRFALAAAARAACPPAPGTPPCQVDVRANQELTVTFASPRFVRFFGTASCLQDLLEDTADFASWLEKTANLVWDGRQAAGPRDYGALVLGTRGKEKLCLVKALFVNPASVGCQRRQDYRVSVKIYGLLSGASSASSTGTGSVSEARSRELPDRAVVPL